MATRPLIWLFLSIPTFQLRIAPDTAIVVGFQYNDGLLCLQTIESFLQVTMSKPSKLKPQGQEPLKRVKTPCIGVCSTGIGDQVCRGCKRFVHEVVSWNAYSNEQRFLIAQRLESFLSQVVSNKLVILDVDQLHRAIRHQQIAFNEHQNPYCWIFDLLKAGASQISDLSVYGVDALPQWQNVSLTDIKQAIDEDYFILSSAYYERYFTMPFQESSH